MAAYNPNGAEPARRRGTGRGRDEGYLYWVAWLGHNGRNLFSAGDGNGFYRRIYLSVGCEQLIDIVESGNPRHRSSSSSSSPASRGAFARPVCPGGK